MTKSIGVVIAVQGFMMRMIPSHLIFPAGRIIGIGNDDNANRFFFWNSW